MTSLSLKHWQKPVFLGLILCILFSGAAFWIVAGQDYRNSDFFSYWLAGKLVLAGEDPYQPAVWVAGHDVYAATWVSDDHFLYPLPLAVLFIPLGCLSLETAYMSWVMLSMALTVSAVLLTASLARHARVGTILFPLFAGLVIFRPLMVVFRNGQLAALLLFLLAASLVALQRGHWLVGGVLLGCLILKPSLGVPVLILAGLWMLFHRHGRGLVGMVIAGAVLLLVGLLVNAHWVETYLQVGAGKLDATFGYSPTVWGLAYELTGTAPGAWVSGGGLAALIFVVSLWCLWKESSPVRALRIVLPAALLITPYLWAYDQTLLILPLVGWTAVMLEQRKPFLQMALLPLCVSIFSLVLLLLAVQQGVDVWSVLLPLIFWCVAILPYRPKCKTIQQ